MKKGKGFEKQVYDMSVEIERRVVVKSIEIVEDGEKFKDNLELFQK